MTTLYVQGVFLLPWIELIFVGKVADVKVENNITFLFQGTNEDAAQIIWSWAKEVVPAGRVLYILYDDTERYRFLFRFREESSNSSCS